MVDPPFTFLSRFEVRPAPAEKIAAERPSLSARRPVLDTSISF